MDRSFLIKNHANLDRITKPALAARAVLAKLNTDLRALDRRADLYDHERTQLKAEARAAAEATVRKHERDQREALAEYRSWSTQHTDDPPSGEEAQRRGYYSVRAQAELAHLPEADRLALLQRMAATGDKERGQEYVAAARGLVPPGALRSLERQVESEGTAGARHWGAAMDAVQGQLDTQHAYIAKLLERAGNVTADPERDPRTGAPLPWPGGHAPEAPLDTRILDLWAQGLSGHAGQAFEASKASDTQWSGVAGALPTAGTEGWSDEGDEGAPQPQGDPQRQTDAPADATASQADAQTDAGVQA